ncbi:hypothetical protein [Stakelama pacifica]|uniref:Uncharacterized protein n=1 Tax=Stakelama pacifica TaxID=517720 RepID=A0A4R6FMB3_9SPHN|nr:hypothetical protein [Stakelama pacifica]TDN81775.1 hypothetical protein EV664_107177 [Stakelama pacifica]GGO96535.1 hypothetical protein GCM10011329_23290 [Stakelama pacifica]
MMAIDWKPIADMPQSLKDGREVLLGWWERNVGGTANPRPDYWSSVVVIWWKAFPHSEGRWDIVHTGEYAESSSFYETPTHYAEITPPT